MGFLRGSMTAQGERVQLADAESKRTREEMQQLRKEIKALRRDIKNVVSALPDARRLKQNRHDGSSCEEPGDKYERNSESVGYHEGYGSYGHE